MSTNHTTNYNLSQWEPDDKVLRTDLNDDNDKIDKVLKALDAGKASSSALSSLQSTVSALQNSSAAVKIATGSYNGNGKSGEPNARTLNFTASLGKLPQLLVVRGSETLPEVLVLLQGVKGALLNTISVTSGDRITVTWNAGNNSVTWYGSTDVGHFNRSGIEYRWFAIG